MKERSPVCVYEWRYGSQEMRQIFSRDNMVETYKRVELALLESLVELGVAPPGTLDEAKKAASELSAALVYEEEKKRGHDIASLVFLMGRLGGEEAARWIHFGATSNDVIDTAWALVIRDALSIIKKRLRLLIEKLVTLAEKHRYTVMPGRTHGQHATPITLGFKIANYVYELARSYERICDAEKRVLRAKLGGATGTMASWHGYGLELRKVFASKLGLEPHIVATQVAPRDGFAELAAVLAILASTLDRFAVEIRELARPEIHELWEERGSAIGSSAMPQKANPVTAERISGLARIARSLVHVFLENMVLWHERDLTNSSSERVAIPHLFLTIDQILIDANNLVDRLRVDRDKMKRNLYLTMATATTEALMNLLIQRAKLGREEAYSLARKAAQKALQDQKPLWIAASELPEIRKHLEGVDLEEVLRPENYIGEAPRLVSEATGYARAVLEKC